MNLNFRSDLDRTRIEYLNSKGESILSINYMCFSGVSGRMDGLKDVKTLRVLMADTLLNEYALTPYRQPFISWLLESGLLRYGTLSYHQLQDVHPNLLNVWDDERYVDNYIAVDFDLATGITYQEIFVTALAMRVMAIAPRIVVDFLELVKLYPNEDKWILFLAAHKVTTLPKERLEESNHLLLHAASPKMLDRKKTLAFIQDRYKEFTPFHPYAHYVFASGTETELTSGNITTPYGGWASLYGGRVHFNDFVFQCLFDKEKFIALSDALRYKAVKDLPIKLKN